MGVAVVVIDMINDFVSGIYGGPRAEASVPRVRGLLGAARSAGVPVIHVTDAHAADDGEFRIWRPHAVAGTRGAEVVEALKPVKGDHHLRKTRYSCFYSTRLDSLLRRLGVDTVILTGLVTNICVQHTAADAFFRGYRLVVPRDCVEAVSDLLQEQALAYIKDMYGAEITMSSELIKRGFRT
jgi:nicotinamidase-related amidase